MNRTVTQLVLAIVLAMHSAEVVRYGFAALGLAPNCPVVGNAVRLDQGSLAKDTSVVICTMNGKALSDQPVSTPTDPGSDPEKSKPSRDCQTCKLLAVWRTFVADINPSEVEIGLAVSMAEPEALAVFFGSNQFFTIQGRAPPTA